MNEATNPKTTAALSGQVDQIVMRYAKDFDPATPVVENCKYMAALGRIQKLEGAMLTILGETEDSEYMTAKEREQFARNALSV